MSSFSMVIRFRGRSEYRLTDTLPEVGDKLSGDGEDWVVAAVEKHGNGYIVSLSPAEDGTSRRALPATR